MLSESADGPGIQEHGVEVDGGGGSSAIGGAVGGTVEFAGRNNKGKCRGSASTLHMEQECYNFIIGSSKNRIQL